MAFRLRYADVASTLALVVALGGTSYAAVMITSADIQDDTILSQDIRNATLASADVGTGGIHSIDVLDNSLGLVDISAAAETALKGQQGDPGTPGAPGAPGEPGAPGANGVSGYVDAVSPWMEGTAAGSITAQAVCPAGKKPIGGGFYSNAGSMRVSVGETHQQTNLDGTSVWRVSGTVDRNGSELSTPWYLQAWAVCATVS